MDPKNVHVGDQYTAVCRDFGQAIGAMYSELIKAGMPEYGAVAIVRIYTEGYREGMNQSQRKT